MKLSQFLDDYKVYYAPEEGAIVIIFEGNIFIGCEGLTRKGFIECTKGMGKNPGNAYTRKNGEWFKGVQEFPSLERITIENYNEWGELKRWVDEYEPTLFKQILRKYCINKDIVHKINNDIPLIIPNYVTLAHDLTVQGWANLADELNASFSMVYMICADNMSYNYRAIELLNLARDLNEI